MTPLTNFTNRTGQFASNTTAMSRTHAAGKPFKTAQPMSMPASQMAKTEMTGTFYGKTQDTFLPSNAGNAVQSNGTPIGSQHYMNTSYNNQQRFLHTAAVDKQRVKIVNRRVKMSQGGSEAPVPMRQGLVQ